MRVAMVLSHVIVRLLGRVSTGWRLVGQHGVTAAQVVEYACTNEAHGTGRVGRLCDRAFLRTDDCVATRLRMTTVRDILGEVLLQRRAAGQSTVILDVASGSARYLREVARAHGADDLTIVCSDRNPRQVEYGRALAAAENLAGVSFWVGDATDVSSYLTGHDPGIVVAVDIFPYLGRDDAVRTVLRLAFDRLSPGGTFVCSTQSGRRPAWWATGLPAHRVGPIDRTAECVATWLRTAGFADVATRRCGSTDWILVARKPALR